jgi:signal transduction histidine kinase
MVLQRKKHLLLVSALLVGMYGVLALLGMWVWGTNLPYALLLVTLVIITGGVLLGPRAALYTAATITGGMIVVQGLISLGLNPNSYKPEFYNIAFADAIGYGLVFGILALVAWLFGTQIERLFGQTQAAEVALQAEKDSLEFRLEERTKKLQAAQVKEMQQLYKFAELGQLSTSLLHDLANHLTVLTFDIEDLRKKQHGEAVANAKDSIGHLDKLVEKVRSQMQGDNHVQTFSAFTKIQETTLQLKQKANQSDVVIKLKVEGHKNELTTYGDPTRFGQIMTILISNAIEAYQEPPKTDQKVVIEVQILKKKLQISVHDWGKGITKVQASRLFKPFYSSKENGMGIGLFIAKQMAEAHFKGKLVYDDSSDHTVFILQVPRKN